MSFSCINIMTYVLCEANHPYAMIYYILLVWES